MERRPAAPSTRSSSGTISPPADQRFPSARTTPGRSLQYLQGVPGPGRTPSSWRVSDFAFGSETCGAPGHPDSPPKPARANHSPCRNRCPPGSLRSKFLPSSAISVVTSDTVSRIKNLVQVRNCKRLAADEQFTLFSRRHHHLLQQELLLRGLGLIGELSIHNPRWSRIPMRLGFLGPEDMQHLRSHRHQVVRNHRTVALPPKRLGTHDRCPSCANRFEEPLDPILEVRRLHVVGISSKAFVSPRAVSGILLRCATPSQILKMRAINPFLSQSRDQLFLSKMRIAPRPGKSPHIRL